MKALALCRNDSSKGAALVIVLAFVILLTGLVLAYLSRTTTNRQLAQSSYNNTSADLLARSALDIVVNDFEQEILSHPTPSPSYITPVPYGTPAAGQTPIPNLIRRSFSGDPTNRTSSVSSMSPSANGRIINTSRWNGHYLIPRGSATLNIDASPVPSFTAPDWVLVTSQGPAVTPSPDTVIGRYAFAAYDEGGLLDMNLAGYGSYPAGSGGGPNPSPTPWAVNVGRKGVLALADLTALPATPTVITTTTSAGSMAGFLSASSINSIVGWRNFAVTQQADGSFPSGFSFPASLNKQDAYGSYLLDFGDPPYASPSPFPSYPFSSVYPATSNSRTDQAFMTRQELLKLRSSLGFSQSLLQYMGTFSRERNQPARDWNRLNNHLQDRFDITNLGLVKPNPSGTPPSRGKGQTKGKARGRIRGDAGSILDLFGLLWIPADTTITDPHDIRHWGHWKYVSRPGFCNPNSNGCDHIPALRGGQKNDFFQILDYAVANQANGQTDDSVFVATILGLGASLIDQYDNPGDDADPTTGTHTTIIQYGAGYALGWENGDSPDPHPSPALNKPTPLPGPSPTVLNHAFTTVADLGYGLKTENAFTPVNLQTTGSPDATLLDFFTYNPIDHAYPRLGIINLNTKNPPVLAAILKGALKKDVDAAPTPNPLPAVSQTEAMTAAEAIVNETWLNNRPAFTRADIARLTSVAAGAITNPGYGGEEQQKLAEVTARALSEIGQARTWNLFIDLIAQTGRYVSGTTSVTDGSKFTVEGETRYWLHIALGRDLVNGSVDVLGTQLEEVNE
jgi:hypothetical protein